jgi:hypothetical protein
MCVRRAVALQIDYFDFNSIYLKIEVRTYLKCVHLFFIHVYVEEIFGPSSKILKFKNNTV